jgi:proline dehydrogenase
MSFLRRPFLWASTNAWLKDNATRTSFVRRSVRRFMPGEDIDAALAAARDLAGAGINSILTHLGENLARVEDAERVCEHYLTLLDRIQSSQLDAQVSVKPTQLGFDQNPDVCLEHLVRLLDRATFTGNILWLDMESSKYVDGTLSLFRRLRERSASVGIALQAYLYRTQPDLEALLPLAPAIRLVKGAYLEPASVAFAKKSDVDRNYLHLADMIVRAEVLQRPGALLHIATHDIRLQERIRELIDSRHIAAGHYEVAMLFGILPSRQHELARSGAPVRVLISYGEDWFPWYMRRLAERPANIWFVVKSMRRG